MFLRDLVKVTWIHDGPRTYSITGSHSCGWFSSASFQVHLNKDFYNEADLYYYQAIFIKKPTKMNKYCISMYRNVPVGTQRCFNVEKWLKSSCNVDQPLFNVESTLRFKRWNPNHNSTLIPRWRPNLFSTLKTSTTFQRWNNVLIY